VFINVVMPPENSEFSYDSVIAKNKIPDGENMRRLKEIRKAVAKELGDDWVSFMNKSNIPVDIVFNLILPFSMFYYAFYVWDVDFTNPLEFVVYVAYAGWAMMSQSGCFHDLTHRMPFGIFWTKLFAKLMIPNGMGELFYQRHRHHHAKTGELDDPKMRRYWTCSEQSWKRLLCLIFPPYMVALEIYYQRHAAKKWANKIKVNWWQVKAEETQRMCVILSVCYYWGTVGGLLRVFSMICGVAQFNSIRMLTEHAGQDLKDAYNQSTFYESGILLRIAYFGVPQGDLHFVHHTFPKMPNYKNLLWGHQMNPVIEKFGVKKYTSFGKLFYDYFIAYKPYGKEWH